MIAKITTGGGFGGTLDYDRDKGNKNEKVVTLIDAQGVDMNYMADGKMNPDYKAIERSFHMQAAMNPKVSKPVVHIALSFHPKDAPRLSDEYMLGIAKEYMEKMGFVNTQYIIHRHGETRNPHLHIILNRVDNDGKRISDKYEKKRSTALCREITLREGLAWGASRSMAKEQGRFTLQEPKGEKKPQPAMGIVLDAGLSLGAAMLDSGGSGQKQDEQEFLKECERDMDM